MVRISPMNETSSPSKRASKTSLPMAISSAPTFSPVSPRPSSVPSSFTCNPTIHGISWVASASARHSSAWDPVFPIRLSRRGRSLSITGMTVGDSLCGNESAFASWAMRRSAKYRNLRGAWFTSRFRVTRGTVWRTLARLKAASGEMPFEPVPNLLVES